MTLTFRKQRPYDKISSYQCFLQKYISENQFMILGLDSFHGYILDVVCKVALHFTLVQFITRVKLSYWISNYTFQTLFHQCYCINDPVEIKATDLNKAR